MTGWILYDKEDVEKNISFASRLGRELEAHGIKNKLVVLESVKEGERPSIAINRSRNYKFAKKLENMGVRVFNPSYTTEIANDKSKQQQLFCDKVPMMRETSEYPCVIKSVDGHGGSEVFLINNREDEDKAKFKLSGKRFIKQEVCSDIGIDKRVYVVGGEIVCAMKRTSDEFKSNYSLGGKAELVDVTEEEKNIIVKIKSKLVLDYVGIDFIYDNGRAIFNEIEDPVGARMLYENTDVEIDKLLAEYIVQELKLMK